MRDTEGAADAPIVTTDLRGAREAAGLTQHELAERLGGLLSRSYLAMIETGARPFPPEHVEAVEAVLAEAKAERLEFRQAVRRLLAERYPITEAERLALEFERRRREEMLERRNDYGA